MDNKQELLFVTSSRQVQRRKMWNQRLLNTIFLKMIMTNLNSLK